MTKNNELKVSELSDEQRDNYFWLANELEFTLGIIPNFVGWSYSDLVTLALALKMKKSYQIIPWPQAISHRPVID